MKPSVRSHRARTRLVQLVVDLGACAVALFLAPRAEASPPPGRIDGSVVRIFSIDNVDWVEARDFPIADLHGGHGSGTFISSDGVVLTAQHVINGAVLVAVFPPVPAGSTERPEPMPATVAYENKELDFAVLVVSGNHPSFTPLPRGRAPKPTALQHFYAGGYPVRGQQTSALWLDDKIAGALSGDPSRPYRWIVNKQFNGGISGGPVFDDAWTLMGVAVEGGNTLAGVADVGRFVEIGPILADYDQHASVVLARTSADHEAANTTEHRQLAKLATTLMLDTESSHERGELSRLEGGGYIPELGRLAGHASPGVKLLIAASSWNFLRSILRTHQVKSITDIADTTDREAATKALALVVTMCMEIQAEQPATAAKSTFVTSVVAVARRLAPTQTATNASASAPTLGSDDHFTDEEGTAFDEGELAILPSSGLAVRIPDGAWRMKSLTTVNHVPFDVLKRQGQPIYVAVPGIIPSAKRCQAVVPSGQHFDTAPAPFDTRTVDPTGNSMLCMRVGGGRALLIYVSSSADASASGTNLVGALGRAATSELGVCTDCGSPPPPSPPCPSWNPRCESPHADDHDDFNPKVRLGVLRGEIKVLSFTGNGINTAEGGALGFSGLSSGLDAYIAVSDDHKPRIVEVGFANGGRGLVGYDSHNNFMLEAFYGLGFAVRIWHFALIVRGGGGLDVLDGGSQVTVNGISVTPPGVFKLPFGFDLGFDARLRVWPVRQLGFEVGGGFLRRVPDTNGSNWVPREILLDGHFLVPLGQDAIMSVGAEYNDYGYAVGIRGTLGFGLR